MDSKKVKAILEQPTPKIPTEIRSFHGLASIYKVFIRYFINICGPFTKIVRGDRKEFKWIVGVDKNFNMLKQKVIEQPILGPPYFNKVFQVDCDDSSTAIGIFLS